MSAQPLFDRIAKRSPDVKLVAYSIELASQVKAIAPELLQETIFEDFEIDVARLHSHLESVTAKGEQYLKFAVKDAHLLGCLYGGLQPVYFSRKFIARDYGWFVAREHRNGPAAILLLADFETWARKRGARKIFVGQSTGVDVERTQRFFQHCGYRVVGYNTVKDL